MLLFQGYLAFLFSSSWFGVFSKAQQLERFPDDFEFGASTSAYQIEGAWNVDGKGESMWDHLVHTNPDAIEDGTNGDEAVKSYYLYKRDVQLLRELGADNYRLSISWTRILPNGRPDYVNPLGVAYYNAVIDELLAYNITPFITMYHWDLPQVFSEQGGWLNEDIVEWFGDYARVLYQHFGDRVKHWLTINEPYIFCYFGYGIGTHAPLIHSPGVGYYECGRNVLLANARAWHIYNDEFRDCQGGKVGFVVSMQWPIPASNSMEDQQATVDYAAFHIRHYVDPIFTEKGNYPHILIDRVAAASASQGLNASRLRPFTQQQIDYMIGTADFLGLNHYTTRYVYRNVSLIRTFEVPSIDDDLFVGSYPDPSWPKSAISYEYPEGFYQLLIYLKENYNMEIYVTENGVSTTTDVGRMDTARVNYFRNYLGALRRALSKDVKVKGYFAWSLMDNFEWANGYSLRFGLYEVDFLDENRTRSPKQSAYAYKDIIQSGFINYAYTPDPYTSQRGTDNKENDNKDNQGHTSYYSYFNLTVSLITSMIFR